MEFEIIEKIFSIERENGQTIELNIIKWGTYTQKYDLRVWKDKETPLKGFTLSKDELNMLCEFCADFIGIKIE